MNRETISEAIGGISARYVEEAAAYEAAKKRRLPFGRLAIAALLAVCLLAGGVSVFSPGAGGSVTAYAYGTEEALTKAGAIMSTGTINDDGVMTGHPLMFYVTGENIASIRYSCKDQLINFMDWTEKREEFGNAQNFTVPYGEDENEYYFLLIDYVPQATIRRLTDDPNSTIATLEDALRRDVIVLQITFGDGRTATKAIRVELRDDGTFFASMSDYKPGREDAFLDRPDSEPIPRSILYGVQEVFVSFCDAAGEAVEPDALWYDLSMVDHILVRWSGASPETVRVYYTPSGTETITEMQLLKTVVPLDGDAEIAIPVAALEGKGYISGHLHVEIAQGERSVASEEYNVFLEE